mmetsp:Transcript_74134/g.130840  ORF Transcript_74134/g.130840 Transcript_74134/m.130840 type:complete len:231 (-) Transcript_74134:2575-3267(-)
MPYPAAHAQFLHDLPSCRCQAQTGDCIPQCICSRAPSDHPAAQGTTHSLPRHCVGPQAPHHPQTGPSKICFLRRTFSQTLWLPWTLAGFQVSPVGVAAVRHRAASACPPPPDLSFSTSCLSICPPVRASPCPNLAAAELLCPNRSRGGSAAAAAPEFPSSTYTLPADAVPDLLHDYSGAAQASHACPFLSLGSLCPGYSTDTHTAPPTSEAGTLPPQIAPPAKRCPPWPP